MSTTNDAINRRDHAESVLERLWAYQEQQQLCDVVLIAGNDGRRVAAHRVVLSASSDYFSVMFMGSLCETKEKEVTLEEVQGDALEALVQYCYTGSIELREDTVKTLLRTARFLQLSDASTACCNFLAQQLQPSNCVGVANFAEQQSLHSVLCVAKEYICQNFTHVYQNQEFFQLSADQLGELLANDDINVSSEQDVFYSLKSWIEHDPSNRGQHFPKLLASVRLPLLQPSFLEDIVKPVCVSKECMQLLIDALLWHLRPTRPSLISSNNTKPRNCNLTKLLAIGGSREDTNVIGMESYYPSSDEWNAFDLKSEQRTDFGVAVMEEKVIIVGGIIKHNIVKTVDSLDLQTMTLTPLSPMNIVRICTGVAVFKGLLYAVGGLGDDYSLDTVERFNPLTNDWTFVASMSAKREDLSVAVLDGRLYAVGGRDMSDYHSSIEWFDPHTNKWTSGAPMNKSCGEVGVAVANGFLYALGGRTFSSPPEYSNGYSNYMERYNPKTNNWDLMHSFSIGRESIGCALLGDRLMAVGGFDGDTYLDIVEEYNLETNEWTTKAPLKNDHAGICVVAIPKKILSTPTRAVK